MELMKISNLQKYYTGRKALDGVDMEICSGQIIGLLGPNGSGKTTLLKTIAGLLTPSDGKIVYPHGVARGTASRGTIAFLPDHLSFPKWMKVKDAFAFYQEMYPDYSQQKADEMIELLQLKPEDKIHKLSKGMQERVTLGVTFSRKASLYLLDEPLGGIDPLGKMRVLDSILSMQLEESAIILSTHLVKDVETIFDSFYFIYDGKIITQGNAEQLRAESGKTIEQLYMEVYSNVETV